MNSKEIGFVLMLLLGGVFIQKAVSTLNIPDPTTQTVLIILLVVGWVVLLMKWYGYDRGS